MMHQARDSKRSTVWHAAWIVTAMVGMALVTVAILHSGGDGHSALEEVIQTEHAGSFQLSNDNNYSTDEDSFLQSDHDSRTEDAPEQAHRALGEVEGSVAQASAIQDLDAGEKGDVSVKDAQRDVNAQVQALAKAVTDQHEAKDRKAWHQAQDLARAEGTGRPGGTAPKAEQKMLDSTRCDAFCDHLTQGLPKGLKPVELVQHVVDSAWQPVSTHLIQCECKEHRAQWVLDRIRKLGPKIRTWTNEAADTPDVDEDPDTDEDTILAEGGRRVGVFSFDDEEVGDEDLALVEEVDDELGFSDEGMLLQQAATSDGENTALHIPGAHTLADEGLKPKQYHAVPSGDVGLDAAAHLADGAEHTRGEDGMVRHASRAAIVAALGSAAPPAQSQMSPTVSLFDDGVVLPRKNYLSQLKRAEYLRRFGSVSRS